MRALSQSVMKKYSSQDIELKWRKKWEEEGIYSYDPRRAPAFVIDTPPPTVSGALHIGHLFSYTQTDILARFQRMRGKNIFYPMGWDDNGLPTEKRIQNLYGVSCDPSMSYISNLNLQPLSRKERAPRRKISRKNFLQLCHKQAVEDEKKYKALWNRLGLSVDWSQTYRTIGPHAQKISQTAFIKLYEKGLLENRRDPVFWDTQFQTAVSQADMEDRQREGFYCDIRFKVRGGGEAVISTTRPELLPACVALSAHPEDERYKQLFSKTAVTPLFHAEVPILPSLHARPDKGTGILMICTFGDGEDVRFWRERQLPLKQVIDRQGRIQQFVPFGEGLFQSLRPEEADRYYRDLAGLTVFSGRKKIVEILKETGDLISAPKPTTQFVKYYEKGDKPLELIPARQWFIKILNHKEAFLHRGREIVWHPPSMRKRYEQWVEGLNQDWCVSRQRFFGVPVPLWYPLDSKGEADYKKPVLSDRFPVDPLRETAPGYEESQRDQPGGFTGDPDVLDTWATSSLTPLINSSWKGERQKQLFPADLRPQAHEIIRTWAFYTIVQAHFHEQSIPWKQIAVSGWVVDPHRFKMSKSKGNTVTPDGLIDMYSADALRYWAGRAGLGRDAVYDEKVFKTGRKLVTKIFNGSRFVLMQTEGLKPFQFFKKDGGGITEPVDQNWTAFLSAVFRRAGESLESFKYDSAFQLVEKAFWSFCDNYIELVKAGTYQLKGEPRGISGAISLDYSLYLFLKLFAPFLPYITEEVWSWRYTEESVSIHTSLWDKSFLPAGTKESARNGEEFLKTVFSVLEQIRNEKSSKRKSLSSPVRELVLKAPAEQLRTLKLCEGDLLRAGHIQNIKFLSDESLTDSPQVSLTLEEESGS